MDMKSTNSVEIIPGRLFWMCTSPLPGDTPDAHYFSIDESLVYEPFREDFGPLNLAMVVRYCRLLEAKLRDDRHAKQQLIHCCGRDQQKRTNAACLMCAYQVICMGKTPLAACKLFTSIKPPFVPFRDAMTGPSTFALTILDCMEGLQKAMELGWFDYSSFDLQEYEALCTPFGSDASWIVPNKFLAFAGPSAHPRDAYGHPVYTPEDYVPIFHRNNVGLVVRLNNKQYERKRFTDHGIQHLTLFFEDGSCPPPAIASKFLEATEATPGAVAVHCKAGLGRTVTLMGLYAMKHFRFPARAFIGWSRICRPGSVLGPQQRYLCEMQEEMFTLGRLEPNPTYMSTGSGDSLGTPTSVSNPTGRQGIFEEPFTDIGQGERLCAARRHHHLKKAKSLTRLVKEDSQGPSQPRPMTPTRLAQLGSAAPRVGISGGGVGGPLSLSPLMAVQPPLGGGPFGLNSSLSSSGSTASSEAHILRPGLNLARPRRGSDGSDSSFRSSTAGTPPDKMPLIRCDPFESQGLRRPMPCGGLPCTAMRKAQPPQQGQASMGRRQWSAPQISMG